MLVKGGGDLVDVENVVEMILWDENGCQCVVHIRLQHGSTYQPIICSCIVHTDGVDCDVHVSSGGASRLCKIKSKDDQNDALVNVGILNTSPFLSPRSFKDSTITTHQPSQSRPNWVEGGLERDWSRLFAKTTWNFHGMSEYMWELIPFLNSQYARGN